MPFRWTDSHTPLFLEVYQRHECLWNNKCSDYNKSNARDEAYVSMLNDLNIPGLTVPDIKLKIKTVRTRYGAELSKVRSSERSGAVADEVYEPRLFWFKEADAFLRGVTNPKPSSSTSKDFNVTEKNSSSDKTRTASLHLQRVEQQAADDEDDDAFLSRSTGSSPIAPSTTHYRRGKTMRKRSSPSEIHEAAKKMREISDDDKQGLNEFDVFCESLAIQLKKMPLDRALVCQEKLQSVMTNERLFQLTNPQQEMWHCSSTYQQPTGSGNVRRKSRTPSPRLNVLPESTHEYHPTVKIEYDEDCQYD